MGKIAFGGRIRTKNDNDLVLIVFVVILNILPILLKIGLNLWINQLETRVVAKLKRAEASLEKHKNALNEATDTNVESIMEKISASEKKVETCQELLKLIDQLKTQITQKTAKLS